MNLLVLLLLVPLAGAITCALMPGGRSARQMAMFFSSMTLVVALISAYLFYFPEEGVAPDQDIVSGSVASIGFSFHLGIDAISLWLILLTAGLMPLAVAASFASVRERQKEYYAWMLGLSVAMLGVFMARDALLFYVFFELTLIPMFFIIGIWGGPERRRAAGKFFLFTFTGSVFTLAAAVYLGMRAHSFDISAMTHFAQTSLTSTERFWVLIGLIAGFAVKVPIFPVHTWLPLAHTEAPTAGSVILAGVLLKLGTYGLLRLALPIGLVTADGTAAFPDVVWWMGVLCLIGIVYGALVAWVQQDIKKLVAYSSVSHLGFCVLGLLALNAIGIQGSILYMINHGINTGAMFLVIGMIYDRFHTRDIHALSGLAKRMPVMAFFFILFTLASIGLPLTNGFISEFLTILGAFTSKNLGIGFGAVAALGIILGAVYMLHMAACVIWGPLKAPGLAAADAGHGHEAHGAHASHRDHASHGETSHSDSSHGGPVELPKDLSAREIAILVPLALAVVILGVYPGLMSNAMLEPVRQLATAAVPETPATTTTTRPSTTQPEIRPTAVVPADGPFLGAAKKAKGDYRSTLLSSGDLAKSNFAQSLSPPLNWAPKELPSSGLKVTLVADLIHYPHGVLPGGGAPYPHLPREAPESTEEELGSNTLSNVIRCD